MASSHAHPDKTATAVQPPRIQGFDTYEHGIAWVVNRLRRREVARIRYHHYTAFHVQIEPVGGAFDVTVRIGWGDDHKARRSLRPVGATITKRQFDLQRDDALTIDTLLGDIGAALAGDRQ